MNGLDDTRDWMDDTHKLLGDRPQWLSYQEIAKRTNLEKRWVERFAQNYYLNPKIRKVNELHNFLLKIEKKRREP